LRVAAARRRSRRHRVDRREQVGSLMIEDRPNVWFKLSRISGLTGLSPEIIAGILYQLRLRLRRARPAPSRLQVHRKKKRPHGEVRAHARDNVLKQRIACHEQTICTSSRPSYPWYTGAGSVRRGEPAA
jgi:hypothetical protein